MKIFTFFWFFFYAILIQGYLILFRTDLTSISTVPSSSTTFDCLYFHSTDDSLDSKHHLSRRFHRIPFCRRPDIYMEYLTNNMNITNGQAISFNQLYQQNITATQLLTWFAPIDTAERYEKYRHVGSNETFYNCSSPWFGSRCQYRFEGDYPSSFDQLVRDAFKRRLEATTSSRPSACYPFLPTCHGTSSSLCLDWREICDGRFDCLHGEDEEGCDELELNECSANEEYRCHSRGQCIPLSFYHDGYQNIDCLDGSDEMDHSYAVNAGLLNTPCVINPLFTCEERTCRNRNSYLCEDELCRETNQPYVLSSTCDSNRVIRAQQALRSLNMSCQVALLCFFDIRSPFWRPGNSIDRCPSLSSQCNTEWVSLPVGFIAESVQYIYLTNRSVFDFRRNIIPDYFCFDHRYCPGLLPLIVVTKLNNNLTCVHHQHLPSHMQQTSTNSFLNFEKLFQNFVRLCSRTNNQSFCPHPSLYHCNQSMKCVSFHRLVDGVQDCYFGEDESYPACQLNDSRRFTCPSQTTICLAPIAVANNRPDCPLADDEHLLLTSYRKSTKSSIYATYCDGIPDEMGPNDFLFDESDCESWPCNTPYTRCNNGWQCPNGIDELDCAESPCKPDEHVCMVNEPKNIVCLPIEHLYDRYLNNCEPQSHFVRRQIYFEDDPNETTNDSIRWTTDGFITSERLCQKDLLSNSQDKDKRIVPFDHKLIMAFGSGKKYKRFTFLIERQLGRKHLFYLASQLLPFPFTKLDGPSNYSRGHSNSSANVYKIDPLLAAHCHRGIFLRSDDQPFKTCLCPPSSFGDRCQYQSQRVSLTLQFIYRSLTRSSSFYIIVMLIDQHGHIAPHVEHWTFVPFISCGIKHNFYLLYPQRPKNISHNYFVHIDVYDRMTLQYHTSWHLSIPYAFLPVNRLVARLIIPDQSQIDHPSTSCSLSCGRHGQCQRYSNKPDQMFCRCHSGYRGSTCNESFSCSCATYALCHSSSICLCPLDRFGRECYLEHSVCRSDTNPCQHGGTCIPDDPRSKLDGFSCLCQPGYMGVTCEKMSNHIDMNFDDHLLASISMVTVHIITVFDDKKNERMTLFKKVPIDTNRISLFLTDVFHIVFVELSPRNMYLALVRGVYKASESINVRIRSDHRCLPIDEIHNDSTWLTSPVWSRAKSYPRLCREDHQLTCFYDHVLFCLCDQDRFAQCVEFNQSMVYDCDEWNTCQHGGRCLLNNYTCPTVYSCICQECFYGSRCQFSTRGYVLTLESIIGYHIKPHRSLYQQTFHVKLTFVINIVLSLIGSLSSMLSIVTFSKKAPRKYGCGVYLLASSTISLLIILVLNFKVCFLIFSQMMLIHSEMITKLYCVVTDGLLRTLVTCWDWLCACVSFERLITVKRGVRFNRKQHLSAAKRILCMIIAVCFSSHMHDPLHRRLVDDFDVEEKRHWCFVDYSASTEQIDSAVMFFHFLIPFSINLISGVLILLSIVRSRSSSQVNIPFRQHLRIQTKKNKHLILAPVLLVILGIPRLIIPFLTRCMKTPRNPILFLIGYFITYIPMILSFLIFVTPSKIYRNEFRQTVRTMQRFYRVK